MKTIKTVMALFLLAGTALCQTVPVEVGEEVYLTSSAVKIETEGPFVCAVPGQAVRVVEVTPTHLVVVTAAAPETKLKVDRTKVVKTPISKEQATQLREARMLDLDLAIKAKRAEIAALKDKILRKERNGTIRRKQINKTNTSMQTLPAKEDLELVALDRQRAALDAEKSKVNPR